MLRKSIISLLMVLTSLTLFQQKGFSDYSSFSYGWTYNSIQYMIGGRAAELGGAFTAIADDSSAVWYNPSGLANLNNVNINISATTYSYYTGSVDNFMNYQGHFSADNREDDFSIIPTTVVFGNRLGEKAAYAIGIFIPEESHLYGDMDGESVTTDEHHIIRANYVRNRKNYSILAGIGTEPLKNLRVGISAGFSYIYGDSLMNFSHWALLNSGSGEVLNYKQTTVEGTSYSFYMNTGFQYSITESNKFGINILTPAWALNGKRTKKVFISNVDAGGPSPNDSLTTTVYENELFDRLRPWSASIGYAFELKNRICFSVDVIPVSSIPGDDTPFQNRIINYRAGLEVFINDGFVFRTGFYTDLTQQPGMQASDGAWNRKMDYYCGTAGVSIKSLIGTENNYWTDMGCTVRYGTGDIKTIYVDPVTGNPSFNLDKYRSWDTQVFIAETLHF